MKSQKVISKLIDFSTTEIPKIGNQNTNQKLSSLLDSFKTKVIKRDIKLKEQSLYSSISFSNKFIVTRVLGHPEIQNDPEKWAEVQDCWI